MANFTALCLTLAVICHLSPFTLAAGDKKPWKKIACENAGCDEATQVCRPDKSTKNLDIPKANCVSNDPCVLNPCPGDMECKAKKPATWKNDGRRKCFCPVDTCDGICTEKDFCFVKKAGKGSCKCVKKYTYAMKQEKCNDLNGGNGCSDGFECYKGKGRNFKCLDENGDEEVTEIERTGDGYEPPEIVRIDMDNVDAHAFRN
eukprot:m.341160 g.341160  ORF g.341160 m.341160 type:complete len:203 (+) comp19870_c0_seq1:130-738(+)